MAFKEFKVQPYEIHYMCDRCNGPLKSRNIILAVNPPLFIYQCTACGEEYKLDDKYPKTIYKEIK